MARRTQSIIDTSGPFFTKDPTKSFRGNIRDLMDAIAREGEGDVKVQLRQGENGRYPLGGGIRPGRVSGWIVGRTVNRIGRRWQVTAVVSVNNSGLTSEQGITLMAAASYLEGQLHVFRRTTSRLRRGRAVNQAELLKGLK